MIESKFVVLKGNGGISVKVCGDVFEYNSSFDKNVVTINERLFLECDNTYSSAPRQLGEREERIIHSVIEGMAELIVASSGFTRSLIRIQGLSFSELDYQEEGLVVAMIQWITKAFDLNVPSVPVNYDRVQNRYLFNFAELYDFDFMRNIILKIQPLLDDSPYPFMR